MVIMFFLVGPLQDSLGIFLRSGCQMLLPSFSGDFAHFDPATE